MPFGLRLMFRIDEGIQSSMVIYHIGRVVCFDLILLAPQYFLYAMHNYLLLAGANNIISHRMCVIASTPHHTARDQ